MESQIKQKQQFSLLIQLDYNSLVTNTQKKFFHQLLFLKGNFITTIYTFHETLFMHRTLKKNHHS